MRRINWQREMGRRRQMVEMVKEGKEEGTWEVLRTKAGKQMRENWRGRGGEAERDQETKKTS